MATDSRLRYASSVAAGRLSPRLQLAGKAALASGIGWQLALLFPASVDQYAYYAPLGAVLAMYPTLVSSVQAALQTVLGILLGATIAMGAEALVEPNAWTVALVIALGTAAGALHWLGEQRAWVPITALFVFAIGDPGSPSYIVGYIVLTLLGAAVGTLVNLLVLPPLHLRQSRRALESLQHLVIAQLEELAEGVEESEAPDRGAWERRTQAVSPAVSTMRQAVADMDRARRGNPRARRHRQVTDAQERHAQAFQRIALLVEDLVDLLEEVEQVDIPALPFNEQTRYECADAMRRLADLARAWTDGMDTDEAVRAACASLERLEDSLARDPRAGGSDPFVAGSVVTLLRRCLGALVTCGGPTAIASNRSRLFR